MCRSLLRSVALGVWLGVVAMGRVIGRGLSVIGQLGLLFGRAVASAFGQDELALIAALGLIAFGLWDVWRPGSFIAPGIVLLWIYLPARLPFVVTPAGQTRKARRTS